MERLWNNNDWVWTGFQFFKFRARESEKRVLVAYIWYVSMVWSSVRLRFTEEVVKSKKKKPGAQGCELKTHTRMQTTSSWWKRWRVMVIFLSCEIEFRLLFFWLRFMILIYRTRSTRWECDSVHPHRPILIIYWLTHYFRATPLNPYSECYRRMPFVRWP